MTSAASRLIALWHMRRIILTLNKLTPSHHYLSDVVYVVMAARLTLTDHREGKVSGAAIDTCKTDGR